MKTLLATFFSVSTAKYTLSIFGLWKNRTGRTGRQYYKTFQQSIISIHEYKLDRVLIYIQKTRNRRHFDNKPNQRQIAVGLTSLLEVVVIVSHKLIVSRGHGGAFSSRPLSQHARARGLNPNYPILEFSANPD